MNQATEAANKYTLIIKREGEEVVEESFPDITKVHERVTELRGSSSYDSRTYVHLYNDETGATIRVI